MAIRTTVMCARIHYSQAAIVLALLVQSAIADLHIVGPKCKALQCQLTQYCSEFDSQCKDCADICDRSSHNFEEGLCESSCQDYLHDVKYVSKGTQQNVRIRPGSGPEVNYQPDIDKLYKLVTAALVLLIILIIVIILYAVHKCYSWAKKNEVKLDNVFTYFKREAHQNEDIEKGSPNGLSNASTATPKRDLRLNIVSMPQSEQPSATTPATMTTSISRRPAEDSALDYAYDNHGMSGTPSPHSGKPARESNF